jgi:hypothetical protein
MPVLPNTRTAAIIKLFFKTETGKTVEIVAVNSGHTVLIDFLVKMQIKVE